MNIQEAWKFLESRNVPVKSISLCDTKQWAIYHRHAQDQEVGILVAPTLERVVERAVAIWGPAKSAGNVSPYSKQLYQVTAADDHRTLKNGDTVFMVECPHCFENLLIRPFDRTAHGLTDTNGQYIRLKRLD